MSQAPGLPDGTFLHGWLQVEVHSAANLRDIEASVAKQHPVGGGHRTKAAVQQVGKFFQRAGRLGLSTTCVVALLDGENTTVQELLKTKVKKGHDPTYNGLCTIEVAGSYTWINFSIIDRGLAHQELFSLKMNVAQLANQQTFDQSVPLLDPAGRPIPDPQPQLRVTLRYWSLRDCPPLGQVVPGTNFPAHSGCEVRLYQDAHQEPGVIPEVKTGDGKPYRVHSCWGDTALAIAAAKEFIYVAGWSVYPELRLIRRPGQTTETLGELLVRKAKEGVVVCVLVWDDASSISFAMPNGQGHIGGVMGTHDEVAKGYFRNTPVHCYKASRTGGRVDAVLKAVYTHHQKCVICDCDAGYGMRDLLAFVGGIDLTNGRYDTAAHSLFDTFGPGGVHEDDFYTCIPDITQETGPRQPWEDIHCRLHGPVAHDVLTNFEERWQKLPRASLKKLYNHGMGLGNKFVQNPPGWPDAQTVEQNPELWTCQLFRSIDARSVEFRNKAGLRRKYNREIDDSIHRAYVHQIRRAERFIYIENQYFLGSSHAWKDDRMKEASHLVPLEVALKISSKIDRGEPFAVYCVIPLHPEGDPEAETTQSILWWQHRTIEMMYSIVTEAIRRNNLSTHPTDYLSFFCLGKREPLPGGGLPPFVSSETDQQKDVAARLCESRRFMIYVHSKLMIVDDEYCLLGSANINMRSMAGTRDSELAVGSYQPGHTIAGAGSGGWPQGQVHGLRMSLWAEHLGMAHPAFERPNTLGCMHLVKAMAAANWETYCAHEPRALEGHLMVYPIKVGDSGELAPVDFGPTIPDFPEAAVQGQKSPSVLPLILTT
mmetsp:Transcript_33779/g.95593  ORF Transcript_33779/g.95593 Transcript_33779/m.95593 type:complete len:822 (+) Transcript_33779:110-2575(+)